MALTTKTINITGFAPTSGDGFYISGGKTYGGINIPITIVGGTTSDVTIQIFNASNVAVTASPITLASITKASFTTPSANTGTPLSGGTTNSVLSTLATDLGDINTAQPISLGNLAYYTSFSQNVSGSTPSTYSAQPVIVWNSVTNGHKVVLTHDDAVTVTLGKTDSGNQYITAYAYTICCVPSANGCLKYKTTPVTLALC